MTEEGVRGLKEYMATYPDPVAAAFGNAPWDDEPTRGGDLRMLAEAQEWFEQNGGKGIPGEAMTRELGLVRFEHRSECWLDPTGMGRSEESVEAR